VPAEVVAGTIGLTKVGQMAVMVVVEEEVVEGGLEGRCGW